MHLPCVGFPNLSAIARRAPISSDFSGPKLAWPNLIMLGNPADKGRRLLGNGRFPDVKHGKWLQPAPGIATLRPQELDYSRTTSMAADACEIDLMRQCLAMRAGRLRGAGHGPPLYTQRSELWLNQSPASHTNRTQPSRPWARPTSLIIPQRSKPPGKIIMKSNLPIPPELPALHPKERA